MSRQADTAGREERLLAEAGYRCGYCHSSQRIMGVRLILDHLTPRAHGGTDHEENLWSSCQPCNGFKQARTEARDPVRGKVVPLLTRAASNGANTSRGWTAGGRSRGDPRVVVQR